MATVPLYSPRFTRRLPWVMVAWQGRSILKLEEFGLPRPAAKAAIKCVRSYYLPGLIVCCCLLLMVALPFLADLLPRAFSRPLFILFLVLYVTVIVFWTANWWHGRNRHRAIELLSLVVHNLLDIRGVATSCSSTRAEARSVRRLASTRRYLRSQAWQLSKLLARICGFPKSERQHPNVATMGRWICWASEDVHDKRRSEAVLSVCVDAIMQLTGPTPWRPLRLPYPPGVAEMKRPMRSEQWLRLWQSVWRYLLPLTPLLTASLALIAKKQ
jgi:hypothetical protein